jgi:hypothetical protein
MIGNLSVVFFYVTNVGSVSCRVTAVARLAPNPMGTPLGHIACQANPSD